jgi:hypothetical protein
MAILGAMLVSLDASGQSQPIPQLPRAPPTLSWEPMSDKLRDEIEQLVVVASYKAAEESITGSYEESTPGLIGGINEGADLGTLDTEIGGVNVSFPVPILTLPGAVYGGISGTMKREMQEFRDELTEELANAEMHPLTNTSLALDVHHNLTGLPQHRTKLIASSVMVPEEADAILYVGFSDVKIHVEGAAPQPGRDTPVQAHNAVHRPGLSEQLEPGRSGTVAGLFELRRTLSRS